MVLNEFKKNFATYRSNFEDDGWEWVAIEGAFEFNEFIQTAPERPESYSSTAGYHLESDIW